MIQEIRQVALEYYVDEQGREPVTDWIAGLRDLQARLRIKKRLDQLSLGNFGDSRFVGEGVFELKLDFGPGYRVYFSNVGGAILLLLCGGDKSSQEKDIERAKEYLKDYRRLHGDKK